MGYIIEDFRGVRTWDRGKTKSSKENYMASSEKR